MFFSPKDNGLELDSHIILCSVIGVGNAGKTLDYIIFVSEILFVIVSM